MHEIQQKILDKSKDHDVLNLGIRPLGKLIGVDKPQLVKHHLQQLIKKGFLEPKSHEDYRAAFNSWVNSTVEFVRIPVLGFANCGPATLVAEEQRNEFLTVSSTLVGGKRASLFALIAKGESMNDADVGGQPINDGDYVVVDGSKRLPQNGDYVVSVIEGCANIKKYNKVSTSQIALLSVSKEDYDPIYISKDDQFLVNGVVIEIIKRSFI